MVAGGLVSGGDWGGGRVTDTHYIQLRDQYVSDLEATIKEHGIHLEPRHYRVKDEDGRTITQRVELPCGCAECVLMIGCWEAA